MQTTESESKSSSDEKLKRYGPQVETALNYVADNLYDYGPEISNKPIIRKAVDVTEAETGTVRVFIEYHLANSPRNSGLEYVDISSEGKVLARRQIRPWKKPQPWFLIGITTFSIIGAAVLIPIFFAIDAQPASVAAGRVLWVRIVEDVRTAPELHFRAAGANDEPTTLSVRPTVPGNNIAYVRVAIINQQESAELRMIIDEGSAVLLGDDGVNYSPINVDTSAIETEPNPRYIVEGFQYIWGSVTLPQGFQIQGYLVFETPPGAEFSQFRWRTVDTVTLLLN